MESDRNTLLPTFHSKKHKKTALHAGGHEFPHLRLIDEDPRKRAEMNSKTVVTYILVVLLTICVLLSAAQIIGFHLHHNESHIQRVDDKESDKTLCEDGWYYLVTSDFCARSFELRYSWLEAQLYCVENGANLISIHSTMENVVVHNMFAQDDSVERFWIGAHSPNVNKEYRWIDRSPMFYYYFGTTSLGWHFHCSTIVPDNYLRWNNVDCDLKHFFICKKPRA
ncbi:hypothetical protein QR680_008325 [Steinernema hermaphroditum]|uniref:C-type lectin domain-containing protein n=1 Tax=Steinernema hermaphroditum TaxID=289476 RepID=A0AA39IIH6_9BILA|nr:hypothetical protein QR680_008325 [Steinernema hermaphroditum]